MDSVSSTIQFGLFDYVKEALEVGRNYVPAESRARIRAFCAARGVENGRNDVEDSWGLIERFLWCENFTNVTPRHNYLSYTYSPLFDLFLADEKFWHVQPRAWQVLSVLLNDWLSFEQSGIRKFAAGEYQKKNFVPELVDRRVRDLERLLAGIERYDLGYSIHGCEQFSQHEHRIDSDHLGSAHDGMLGLAILTGLPSSNYHDEYMFLRLVQITECVFGVVGKGIGACADLYAQHKRREMVDIFRSLNVLMDFLLEVFSLLDTLKVGNFVNGFRADTGDAGAIQSNKYQYLESILSGISSQKMETLRQIKELKNLEGLKSPAIPTLRDLYQRIVEEGCDPDLEYFSRRLLKVFQAWKSKHFGVASKQLPEGFVGNSFGGVGYLKANLTHGKINFKEQQRGLVKINIAARAREDFAGMSVVWIFAHDVDFSVIARNLDTLDQEMRSSIEENRSLILGNLQHYHRSFQSRGVDCPLIKQFDRGLPRSNAPVVARMLLASEFYRGILAGIFDLAKIDGDILLDVSLQNEKLTAIGGREVICQNGDLVLRDRKGIIASYLGGPGQRTAVMLNEAVERRSLAIFLFALPGLYHTSVEESVSQIRAIIGSSIDSGIVHL